MFVTVPIQNPPALQEVPAGSGVPAAPPGLPWFRPSENDGMSRKLQLLFRRDPTRDRQDGKIHYEGYEILWPDGRRVALGLEALCKHGQRLLSLGRHLAGCRERLLDLLCFPLTGPDDKLTRLPGHRVRRFYIERRGRQGVLHFFEGTPTAVVLEVGRDEPRVLQW